MKQEGHIKERLLDALYQGKSMSSEEAAKDFGVSARHIRRLIAQLVQDHPIERIQEGKRAHYKIPPEHLLLESKAPPALDTQEALAVSVAAAGSSMSPRRTTG